MQEKDKKARAGLLMKSFEDKKEKPGLRFAFDGTETLVSLGWGAKSLRMGSWIYVANNLSACEKNQK
jgi:hypothetical protein